jgi:methionyl-tRNA formyltransferase
MTKLRIAFMGTPDFSVAPLKALYDAGHEVVAVYSQPPRPAGRGKKLRPGPVHQFADDHNIPVHTPLNFKNDEDVIAFKALNADVAVVVAYGLLLPKAILDAPKHGCVNIHASLLPRWRGAAPIHRAIMAGDETTGICIMQMDEGLDTGTVIMRESIVIEAVDTTETLHDKLATLGANMIVAAVEGLAAGTLMAEAQPSDGITYAKKIDKAEARIDWSRSAQEIDRLVRGLNPFPGAWFEIEGTRIKVLAGKTLNIATQHAGVTLDDKLTISTGDGVYQITKAQRAGKGAMDTSDMMIGFPVGKGTVVDGVGVKGKPK